VSEGKAIRTGRNLPVAVAVGAALGGAAVLTLFTLKATFLGLVTIAVGIALLELSRACGTREISLPLIPIAAGGAAMLGLAYWVDERAALDAFVGTVILLLAWRLRGGTAGYVRDLTAGVFALTYLPLLAVFVPLMLARPDGSRRTLIFVAMAVCSDVGGYFAGILFGRHQLAPGISPNKTWEGFAGSVLFGVIGGAILLTWLLHGRVWQGIILGAAAVAAATLGDLAASMIKRDLDIKDFSSVLPGHGGVLDRIDSLLLVSPVVWFLLTIFIPHSHH
jgi:phosphatidate cytidylyltransferase